MNSTRKVWPGCAALSALAIVAAVSPRAARATEVTTRLDYGAAPGCPSADDLVAAVVGRLGYRPFRKDAPGRVIVRIEPDGKGLEGHIEWRDATGGWIGEQTLPSRTGNCPELVRAMGFALAVKFQLMATLAGGPGGGDLPVPARAQPPAPPASSSPVSAAPSPSPSTSASASSPPAEPVAAATLSAPTAASESTAAKQAPREHSLPAAMSNAVTRSSGTSSGPSLVLGAGAAVAFAAAPSTVPLARLFGAVGWSHVVVELAGEISSSSTTHLKDGAGFTHRQVLGSLAGCGVVSSWGACVVAKVGQMRVAGQGVDVPAHPTGLLTQMGVRLTWTHMFSGRFEIAAHADGLALATKGDVTLDSMQVWETPRFTASVGFDVGVRFR